MPGNTPPNLEEQSNKDFKMIEKFLRQNNVMSSGHNNLDL